VHDLERIPHPGIVICSRLSSSRVPGKALKKINGVPCLTHLLNRLDDFAVWLAIPPGDTNEYMFLRNGRENVKIFTGPEQDPLLRMTDCSMWHAIDPVIRITHDKVFVDSKLIKKALRQFKQKEADYLYVKDPTEGTGFEIISRRCLLRANRKFPEPVEHISYAARAVSKKTIEFKPPQKEDWRLLIDYPEDTQLMELLFQALGNDCSMLDVQRFLTANPWAVEINRQPLVTVYTCAYNAQAWIPQAMESVALQAGFDKCEYVIVDDHSTDDTPLAIARFAERFPNVRWMRNQENKGLAASSNIALEQSRGKYIVRLDADDWFPLDYSLDSLVKGIGDFDAIYPDNFYGSFQTIQKGNDQHHIGGALFKTSAVNHVKFNDRLRNYEGLDFFERAREQLKIGYLEKPVFFYRQHSGSMSKSNLEERKKVHDEIKARD
jgi:spore coat polysaccharide biosynthesis protein SpsF (cytidylyltransferase family)